MHIFWAMLPFGLWLPMPGDAMSDVHYTADWSPAAIVDFHLVCRELDCDPIELACPLYAESGAYATAHNPNGDASGIFQAMPSTLVNLGFHPELEPKTRSAAFRGLGVRGQLPYLRRYYSAYKGKLQSVALIYVATFTPAFLDGAIAGGPDFVLVDSARSAWDRTVFTANSGFDDNGDLKITVAELDDAVRRQCRGARWNELRDRLGAPPSTEPAPTSNMGDLGTVFGLQRALSLVLGMQLDVDGIWGPRTRDAVMVFQKEHPPLVVDGKPGPRTRLALAESLSRAEVTEPT